MRKIQLLQIFFLLSIFGCKKNNYSVQNEFNFISERFDDVQILKYQIPDFDKLTLKQKKLVYYLSMAGYSGRDIIWDQNYRHNLAIRRVLENIINNYDGDKNNKSWENFILYTKKVWFANGIHHHYSMTKFKPKFSKKFFIDLMHNVEDTLKDEALKAIFDENFDNKKVNLDPKIGLVLGSAVNFYDPSITENEVDKYYKSIKKSNTKQPISYGLNSKLIKNNNNMLEEKVYKLGGMYSDAIKHIIKWLKLAVSVAENEKQADALKLLIKYYKTGNLNIWDEYNIAWVNATEGDIDYINSFIEVYNDPKGYKGSYESIVEIKDFQASAQMKVLSENAQWFEDNSTIYENHKKKNISGVSYKVVNVASESGDSSPSTPIGVNLPNANWIRSTHGSKSVSLGNIVYAYSQSGGQGILEEFAHDQEEIERVLKYGKLASKLHTALHEVLGHASGKLNNGVGTPKETLKSYASTLEEGRADLVALYFIMDYKLVELGLIDNLEVGKAEYDNYIRNGLLTQLRRVNLGEDIEEAHMRNRQWVSKWVYEKGLQRKVIEKIRRNNKTYYNITDYKKLREIFGELLKEVQRIKSEGDYKSCSDLVEKYGVKIDPITHREVISRSNKLDIAPYSGFINPELKPTFNNKNEITNIEVIYPKNFKDQMLKYAEKFSFLPNYN